MQDKHLYEYAVLRVMPQVEREEFVNVGIVLYCRTKKYLNVIYRIDDQRLLALFPHLDIAEVGEYLNSFERICNGDKYAGLIAQLPVAERFRWLTATRSTIVQASKVHPGYCDDPQSTLNRLFGQLVLPMTHVI